MLCSLLAAWFAVDLTGQVTHDITGTFHASFVTQVWAGPNDGRKKTIEEETRAEYNRMQRNELEFRLQFIQRRLAELAALEGGWLVAHHCPNGPLDRGVNSWSQISEFECQQIISAWGCIRESRVRGVLRTRQQFHWLLQRVGIDAMWTVPKLDRHRSIRVCVEWLQREVPHERVRQAFEEMPVMADDAAARLSQAMAGAQILALPAPPMHNMLALPAPPLPGSAAHFAATAPAHLAMQTMNDGAGGASGSGSSSSCNNAGSVRASEAYAQPARASAAAPIALGTIVGTDTQVTVIGNIPPAPAAQGPIPVMNASSLIAEPDTSGLESQLPAPSATGGQVLPSLFPAAKAKPEAKRVSFAPKPEAKVEPKAAPEEPEVSIITVDDSSSEDEPHPKAKAKAKSKPSAKAKVPAKAKASAKSKAASKSKPAGKRSAEEVCGPAMKKAKK
eukprot:g16511.t1